MESHQVDARGSQALDHPVHSLIVDEERILRHIDAEEPSRSAVVESESSILGGTEEAVSSRGFMA